MFEPTPTEQIRVRSRQQALALVAFALIALLFPFIYGLTLPILVALKTEFAVSTPTFSLSLSASTLAGVIATPLAGRAADSLGARPTLLVITIIAVCGGVISGFAPSFGFFLAGQILTGCGLAGIPAMFVMMRSAFRPDQVKLATGLVIAMLTAGEGLALLLAGPLTMSLSRALVYAIPSSMLLVALLALSASGSTEPKQKITANFIPWTAAALLSLGLLGLFAGFNVALEFGWGPVPAVLFSASALFLVLWFVREKRAADPLVPLSLIAKRGVWPPMLLAAAEGATLAATSFLVIQRIALPKATGYGLDADSVATGLFLFTSAVAGIIAAPLAGKLAGRIGTGLTATFGAALLSTGALLLLLTSSQMVVVGLVVVSIGSAASSSSAYAAATLSAPADEVGMSTAMVSISRSLGLAIGSQVAASVLVDPDLPQTAFTLGLLLAAAIAATGLVTSTRFPKDARR